MIFSYFSFEILSGKSFQPTAGYVAVNNGKTTFPRDPYDLRNFTGMEGRDHSTLSIYIITHTPFASFINLNFNFEYLYVQ